MDLLTAVAASMIPASSRSRLAVEFRGLREALADVGQPREALTRLLTAVGLPADKHELLVREAFVRAERAIATAASCGMTPIVCGDPSYPALLACIADPPPVVWTRGNRAILDAACVAIVGSRAATPYALEVGSRLARELALRGVVVVSGLARGVDSSAHRGCLAEKGKTVAVLGSGLDCVYPPEHEGLAAEIAQSGLVISELGPGAAPLPEHFPLRNRIISGISLGVVVVEASEKSGSLITARYALEQGRDVMAVPGSVLSGRNRGSHSLLKDGAKVVETADDILEELGWPAARPSLDPGKILNSDPLLACMAPGEAYQLDELMGLTGTAPAKLLPRLMELELLGLVTAADGRFIRVPARSDGAVPDKWAKV
jgi:DNA processing protein